MDDVREMHREARWDARRKSALRRARIALYRAWHAADKARPDDSKKAKIAALISDCERTMVAFYDETFYRDDGTPVR